MTNTDVLREGRFLTLSVRALHLEVNARGRVVEETVNSVFEDDDADGD